MALRTNRRDRHVWRWVRLAMCVVIAAEVVAIVYLWAQQTETQRLREQHDAGMAKFWKVYNELPRQQEFEPVR
jgi:uncharacterized membrane protein